MRSLYNAERVFSSFDDNYYNSLNIFRKLAIRGRNNAITVGDCGQKTVDFSQFFSCIGLTVQETTTLTATFTKTTIYSTGYTAFTVRGCTPLGFPYFNCQWMATNSSGDIDYNVFTTTPSNTEVLVTHDEVTRQAEEHTADLANSTFEIPAVITN